ncbi:hypothetical protein JYU34_005944 [Plutella xylostella]|uniref:Superoxide dismutase [Cu-Zn] n=1 Tax=Plutella xylostella TaxID=51655 RepID=A0ABQ7QUI4_PLUXY|nr:hypothetical protein JYU34_005944 [Plutella xylostella]
MYRLALLLTLSACFITENSAEPRAAIAHLQSENISGSMKFEETDNGVRVFGSIKGLAAGKYGFHIHELGDVSSCAAAGAHFNPESRNHGAPDNGERHVGDLGNIQFKEDGTADIDIVDTVITLRGATNVIGRTLMLHEGEDDLGLGGDETSLTTGNAGGRVACGVIGVDAPLDAWLV